MIIDFFNFTLPCGLDCPLEQARPRSCHIDLDRQIIMLGFDLLLVDTKAKVMAADPFSLITNRKHNNSICFTEYLGPRSIIVDSETNCVAIMRGRLYDENNDLILRPEMRDCIRESAYELNDKYWSTTR